MVGFAFVAISISYGVESKACPPLGAVLPPPKQPSKESAVIEAVKVLQEKITNITSHYNASAISIGVQSVHENTPIVDLHHTPATKNANGTQKVTADTVYRIGSCTKVFTVLALLQQKNIRWDEPVTKYLPELKQNQPEGTEIEAVQWDSITIGALASHVSGIGRDLAFDLANFPGFPGEKMGLKPLTNDTRARHCSGLGNTKACGEQAVLINMPLRHPQYAPYTAPLYSNVGITILGLVVQKATNQSLDQLLRKKILGPADMQRTSLDEPPVKDSEGFIPANDPTWATRTGVFASSGGMYSSTKDMLSFGSAILSHKLLSPLATRKWLSPTSFTSSRGHVLGAPWEIQRADRLAPDGRIVDIYAKAGDLGQYHSMFALVPDYAIVISVMAAGKEVTDEFFVQSNLVSQTLKAIVPALDAVTKQEANKNFAGVYHDQETDSVVHLEVDDGPGLAIKKWIVRGFDVLGNFTFYNIAASGRTLPGIARLYPSNLEAGSQKAWRMVFDQVDDERGQVFNEDAVYPDAQCVNWATMDRFNYNFVGLEEFAITIGRDGMAKCLSPLGFGVTLTKQN
ncbi:beta-lactamase-like protein-like protein 2 [Triangularia verruculosa]|uniref:Beta-lactamase-like protein-like protein 2 n=1 Tax=Triangularia verruculosa TaxID=2587418 RepID=A0AAN6X663_9PEZI|nr:beta-lactamase-like protein-like protein 2 [Triangularia verruculosa]